MAESQLLHPFNGLFSRTTWVSRYQQGITSLHLNEARDYGVLGRSGSSWTVRKQSAPRCMQITTSTSTRRSIFTGRVLFLLDAQPITSKLKSMGEAHFRTEPLRNPSTNFDVMSNILLRPPQRVDVQNLVGIDPAVTDLRMRE